MTPTTIEVLVGLALQLTTQAAAYTSAVNKARSEGRDVTDAELDALVAGDDAARARLQAAIDAARA